MVHKWIDISTFLNHKNIFICKYVKYVTKRNYLAFQGFGCRVNLVGGREAQSSVQRMANQVKFKNQIWNDTTSVASEAPSRIKLMIVL